MKGSCMQTAAQLDVNTEISGLTDAQVADRQANGQTNDVTVSTSRSVNEILRANIFTIFNLILGVALLAILLTGSWPDAVFGFVLIINAGTGVLAELRAKRTLDGLAVLDAPSAKVIRQGKQLVVPVAQVVKDDILRLEAGDQIPADGVVRQSEGLEVDESILTGESVPVKKQEGDEVLSGSSVVAGTALAQMTKVGTESYAYKVAGQVKRFSLAQSEIRNGIDTILKVISWIIIPVSLLLAWAQIHASGGWNAVFGTTDGWKPVVIAAVAGVVGMVPQGLVLLTSVNFAVAAVVLARKQVLVQELPAVEVLARVNVICLDKTGTLTTGELEVEDFVVYESVNKERLLQAIDLLVGGEGNNATASAIHAKIASYQLDSSQMMVENKIPFSSARKFSAVSLVDETILLGAPEILFATQTEVLKIVNDYAEQGLRVLAVGQTKEKIDKDQPQVPGHITLLGFVVLREQVRDDAQETLAWFEQQEVDVKVISGDNPTTVAAIAKRIGIHVDNLAVDARTLPDFETDPAQFTQMVLANKIFGRVTPEQKRAMVKAIQSANYTVAMTGDGVNDALAIKDADLGIAMGQGARATKAASKLVLLNGKFSTLPTVMAEGRRVIANMERVSSLFLNKTTYAVILAVVISLLGMNYIFLPRQITLLGIFTIGVPGFCLAIPANSTRYRAGFLKRTLSLAIPAGVIGAIGVLLALFIGQGSAVQASTRATLVLAVTSVALLAVLSKPIWGWRGALFIAMILGIVIAVLIPWIRHFFALATLPVSQWILVGLLGGIGAILVLVSGYFMRKKYK